MRWLALPLIALAVVLALPDRASAQGRLGPMKDTGGRADNDEDDDDRDRHGRDSARGTDRNLGNGDDDPLGEALGDVFEPLFRVLFGWMFMGADAYRDSSPWHFHPPPYTEFGMIIGPDAYEGRTALFTLEADFRMMDADLLGVHADARIMGTAHIALGARVQAYVEQVPGGGTDDLFLFNATWGWQFWDDLGFFDLGFNLGILGGKGSAASVGAGFYVRAGTVVPHIVNVTGHLGVVFVSGSTFLDLQISVGHFISDNVELLGGFWMLAATHARPILGPTIGCRFWF